MSLMDKIKEFFSGGSTAGDAGHDHSGQGQTTHAHETTAPPPATADPTGMAEPMQPMAPREPMEPSEPGSERGDT